MGGERCPGAEYRAVLTTFTDVIMTWATHAIRQ